MSHWIELDSLTDGWADELERLCEVRSDHKDHEWFNLETGSSVVLVPDGSWRQPETARYRVFHRSPNGRIVEITTAALGSTPSRGHWDATENGSGTYREVLREARAAIRALVAADEGNPDLVR